MTGRATQKEDPAAQGAIRGCGCSRPRPRGEQHEAARGECEADERPIQNPQSDDLMTTTARRRRLTHFACVRHRTGCIPEWRTLIVDDARRRASNRCLSSDAEYRAVAF
jgi:hypothetical protein